MTRRAGGFTVVEALVAAGLTGVVLTGITLSGILTMHADTKSTQLNAATTLAETKLEQMRLLARTDPAWTAGAHTESGLNETGNVVAHGPYTRQWTVTTERAGRPSLTRVSVTVLANQPPEPLATLTSVFP